MGWSQVKERRESWQGREVAVFFPLSLPQHLPTCPLTEGQSQQASPWASTHEWVGSPLLLAQCHCLGGEGFVLWGESSWNPAKSREKPVNLATSFTSLSEDLQTEFVRASLNFMQERQKQNKTNTPKNKPKATNLPEGWSPFRRKICCWPLCRGPELPVLPAVERECHWGNNHHCYICNMQGNASYIEYGWEAGQGSMLEYV